MEGMRRHVVKHHRALTMRGITQGLLGRVGVLVLCGVTFASVTVEAGTDIVVPRDFPTIQAAVDAAAPGDTIKVRRGTYTEEIVIGKDLTLKGDGVDETVIEAPATLTAFAQHLGNGKPVGAVVRITDGAHVSLSGLTVTGPTPCAVNSGGIRVVKAATADVSDSRVIGIRPPADGSCPLDDNATGAGIVIGLPPIIVIDGEGGTTGHGTVTGVAIDAFQTTGIVVVGPLGGPLSTATISNNVVTGGTPFLSFGQVGISVNVGAVARMTDNTIGGTVCTVPVVCGRDPINQVQSVGIGAFSSGPGTVINENTVTGNDVGIYLFGSEGCCQTRENTATNNHFFGIVIQDGSNDTAENKISGGEVGVGVVAAFAVDTTAVLRGDKIRRTSIAPVQEIDCCGFTATAVVEHD
jgi:parallel beta-helix repeat protein